MNIVCKFALRTRNEKVLEGKRGQKIDLSQDGCQARSIVEVLSFLSTRALPRSSASTAEHDDRDDCDNYSNEILYSPLGLTLSGVESRAVRGRVRMQREMMATGPLIIIMRLTEEFSTFTGSLFNPSTHTYLDRDGKTLSPSLSSSLSEKDWNNHFLVAVGWAKTEDGTSAWIVMNSWGEIYPMNEITKGMNIAKGKEGKTIGTMIAMNADGKGMLEITTR